MLSGRKIHEEATNKRILIDPFNASQLQPHSYDICLGGELYEVSNNAQYALGSPYIDSRKPGDGIEQALTDDGAFFIYPGTLYIGHTVEIIHTDLYAPRIDGRSSLGRYGGGIHVTAGFIDAGFRGQVVLEIFNLTSFPLKVWPGDRVGQISFEPIQGTVDLYQSGYNGQIGARLSKGLV